MMNIPTIYSREWAEKWLSQNRQVWVASILYGGFCLVSLGLFLGYYEPNGELSSSWQYAGRIIIVSTLAATTVMSIALFKTVHEYIQKNK